MMRKILKLVSSFALVGAALAMLSSCGGGSSSLIPDPGAIINPPEKYFGAIQYGHAVGEYCEAGFGGGIATGYRTQSSAKAAALTKCNTTNSECDSFVTFGSGIFGDNDCEALAYGRSPRCGFGISNGAASRSAAESRALDQCRTRFSNCTVVASGCSTSGPERATPFSSPDAPSNRAPMRTRDIDDVTLRQGEERRIRNVSTYFSDPDGDRLTIIASDGNPNLATVRKSGDDLIISGVNEFTGAVTITVIARDPDGLSDEQTFEVRVTGSSNRAPVFSGLFFNLELEEQGSTQTIENVSAEFSDPDGDQLTITARSNSPRHVTVRKSGDNLIIRGVQGYAVVRITVTARDPAGLSASATFTVQVPAADDQWAAISISDLFPNCTSRWWAATTDNDRSSAERTAKSNCNAAATGTTTCREVLSRPNGCVAWAEGERCGGGLSSGSSRSVAENDALSRCQGVTTNCRIQASICTSNAR